MQEEEFKALLEKYENGTANDEEIAFIESWYLQYHEKENAVYSDEEKADHANEIWAALQPVTRERRIKPLWPRIAAAASIVAILSAGGYFMLWKDKAPLEIVKARKVDVLPGNQSAVLQLSNGQQIALNTAKTGTIAQQNTTNIIKTADNKIVYQAGEPTTEIVYNTVTTKRGNFYPLTLSDGTVAILDAGSSIKYPVAFVGKERRVEITGQVYFEVKHNANMPFRVSVKGQIIEDIGTSFNINAYDDELNIKATLIEGSININNQKTLTPGQQATITNSQIKIEKADTEQAVAWKNGLFNFNNKSMAEAMRQLSRWYDVDIEYAEGLPKIVFQGEMRRNMNASQVLEVLSFFKVHFEIVQGPNGKKILVKP